MSLRGRANSDNILGMTKNNLNNNESSNINNTDCTSIVFGDFPIVQPLYYCKYCDKREQNKMCEYCYYNCHFLCRKEEKKYLTDNKKKKVIKKSKFYCSCGIKLKHSLFKIDTQQFKRCPLSIVDKRFINGKKYYCKTHKISICSVCAFVCHNSCSIHFEKASKQSKFDDQLCNCKNEENHTGFNEFTFIVGLNSYKKKIDGNFWPIQFINVMFTSKEIFEYLEQVFTDAWTKDENEISSTASHFPSLLELFSNIFNNKFKTYYFHNSILKIFPLEQTFLLMKKITLISSENKALIKFRLMYIIIYVHLKRDFKFIKELTSIDFLMNNVLERLKYRKLITSKSVYTKNLFEKYGLNKGKFELIHKIAFDEFLPFMEKGIKTDLLNIKSFQDELEIGLKFISFCLKRCIFDLNDLKELIKDLYNFHDYFICNIKTNNKEDFKNWIEIFPSFAEIFYMIAVSYNDLIVEEYLKNKKKNIQFHLEDSFIHTNSVSGQILYKMIMKSITVLNCQFKIFFEEKKEDSKLNNQNKKQEKVKDVKYVAEFLENCEPSEDSDYNIPKENSNQSEKIKSLNSDEPKKHSTKEGMLYEKTKLLFHESIKIFYITDNKYYYQLKSINNEDINTYYEDIKNIELMESYYLSSSNFNFPFFKENNTINYNNNYCLSLTKDIENILETFFICSNESKSNEIENKIDIVFDEFNKNINLNINEYICKSSLLNDERYILYQKEVLSKYKNNLPFLKDHENHFDYNRFLNELIFSSVDNTLLKMLIFFSDKKYPKFLSFDMLEKVLSLTSLLFLSPKGMKYLLLGKTLARLNRLFGRYSFRNDIFKDEKNENKSSEMNNNEFNEKTEVIESILEFLEKLFKGVHVYKINLCSHKVLKRFINRFFNHVKIFSEIILSSKIKIKELIKQNDSKYMHLENQLHLIFQIIVYITPFYSDIDKSLIDFCVMNYFLNRKLKFFRINKFFDYFLKQNENESNTEDKIVIQDNYQKTNQNDSPNDSKYASEKFLLLKENNSNGKETDIKHENKNTESGNIIDTENKVDKNIELTFSFFEIVRNFDMVITQQKYNYFKRLYKLFEIENEETEEELIIQLFKNNTTIDYNQKNILLNVMQKIFFIQIETISNFSEINKYLSSDEYFRYYVKINNFKTIENSEENEVEEEDEENENSLNEDDNAKNSKDDNNIVKERINERIKVKIEQIRKISMLIEIYRIELERIILKESLTEMEYIYLSSVIKGIKFMADFLYFQRNIWCAPLIPFYTLVLLFVPNTINILKLMLNHLNKDFNIDDYRTKIEEFNKIKKKIERETFNIYDKDTLYNYISNSIDLIYKKTKINKKLSLSYFLTRYGKYQDLNFTPVSLFDEQDFQYFYEEDDVCLNQGNTQNSLNENINLNELIDTYVNEFVDINNTTFLCTLQGVSSDSSNYNFRKNLVQYFVSYTNSLKFDDHFETLLTIMTKSCFYDSDEFQKCFEKLPQLQISKFFLNFSYLIQHYIYRTFVLGSSIFETKKFTENANLTKLSLKFIQLLGEDFCQTFHGKIFRPIDLNDSLSKNSNSMLLRKRKVASSLKNTIRKIYKELCIQNGEIKVDLNRKIIGNQSGIFHNVILSLKEAIKYLNLSLEINSEATFDKLIVMVTNLVDFIIEFIVTNDKYAKILQKEIMSLLFEGSTTLLGIIMIPFKNTEQYRMQLISYIKLKFISLIQTYIQNGKKYITINNFFMNDFTPIKIFNEILNNIKLLLITCDLTMHKEIEYLLNLEGNTSFCNYMIQLYVYHNDFRDSVFLSVSFNLYILIKILESKYKKKDVSEFFMKVKFSNEYNSSERNNKNKYYLKYEYINGKLNLDSNDWIITSKNAYRIFLFLEQLVLRVEIKMEVNKDIMVEKDFNDKDKKISEEEVLQDKGSDEESNSNQISFFIRPYITYFISEQSKLSFENNVNRETPTNKFLGLINISDYFLFEMVVNRKLMKSNVIKKFLVNIQYKTLELINYVCIFLSNAFHIYNNYKSADGNNDYYYDVDETKWNSLEKKNWILAGCQLGYIVIVLYIWFKFKFFLYLEYCILQKADRTFIYRRKQDQDNKKISKEVRTFFQDENSNMEDYNLFKEVNKDMPTITIVGKAIVDSIILNREICIFFLNSITIICYLITKSGMFLVIPILFVANLSTTLMIILKAIVGKLRILVSVYFFTYLFVYLFAWIAYFFLADSFVFGGIKKVVENEDKTKPNELEDVNEAYCYSPIQCWMFINNYGIRQGGGITDSLVKVSFRTSPRKYFIRFFFDIFFHLVVVLILLNVFLGIIVDAFAELGNINTRKENDMNNVCFICQESRDDCLSENIDFDEHKKIEHNFWNYIYYLTSLHLENVLDFNNINKTVWDKLGQQDYSWLPLSKKKYINGENNNSS